MGTLRDVERNDAKTNRIIDACLRSRDDPRIPLSPTLSAEGVHPDEIKRIEKTLITFDSIARLLNYHFTWQTFAVVRKNNTAQLVRLADGVNFTPNNVLREFLE